MAGYNKTREEHFLIRGFDLDFGGEGTYLICSIRRRSRLLAAYNSIAELNKIVAALE